MTTTTTKQLPRDRPQADELDADELLAHEARLQLQAAAVHRRAAIRASRAGDGRNARDHMLASGVAFDKGKTLTQYRKAKKGRPVPLQTREELEAELTRVAEVTG